MTVKTGLRFYPVHWAYTAQVNKFFEKVRILPRH